jgi:glycosyltransferase involved in cell wall biosynthesis
MRIAYDLQACQTDSRDRGIGRYASNLVRAIVAISADQNGSDPVLGLDGTDIERLRDARNQLRFQHVAARSAVYHYPSAAVTDIDPLRAETAARLRGRFYEALAPDVLVQLSHFEWGTNYSTGLRWCDGSKVRSATVAYDLIPLIYPERYLPEGSQASRWYREKCESFKQFDCFLAISESTRSDLIHYLDIPPERICVIGAGLDASLMAASRSSASVHDELLKKRRIDGPFILLVSNGDWRKNTLGALEAFARLPKAVRNRHLLVLTQVGEDIHAALTGPLRHLADRIRILGKVNDVTLTALYRRCAVFFFPSLYEGFGFPVLEAMALGAPVLSSNLGGLPEVVHDPRCLFDPRDPDSAVEILGKVLQDSTFRDSLRQGAQEHARGYTWERCAKKALTAFAAIPHMREKSMPKDEEAASGQLVIEPSDVATWTDFLVEGNALDDAAVELALCAASSRGMRRILVDVSEVARLDARSGIQRVVRNFCAGLHALAANGNFELQPIYWTASGVHYANTYAREGLGLAMPGADSIVSARSNDLLFMLDSSWLVPERFDNFHAQIWQAGGEVVWMVYDLIPILFPDTCDPGMPPAFEKWLSHAVAASDGFVCISQSTRNDLERFMDRHDSYRRRPWARSVDLGSNLESGRVDTVATSTLALTRSLAGIPTFVAVGTLEPRKDHATVLTAFEKLWARDIECALIVVGKRGWNVDELVRKLRNHPRQGRHLFWLEGISDSDLLHILDNSSALIQASLSEGYGLPVVEAGSRGIPLLLSDIPVFHEIAGAAASYFPVGDADHLARLVSDGIASGFVRPVAGEIRAKTWEEVSAELARCLLTSL